MTTWSEVHAAALASVEDAEQKLAEIKKELTTNEDVKSALLEVGEKDALESADDGDDDAEAAIENLSNALDEAQGAMHDLSRGLVTAGEAILKYL